MLDARHGEIKSMRTADAFLRQGVAARMLDHIMAEARTRGAGRRSLETGSGAAFEPAHALYRRYGFAACDPFGDYKPDPFRRFMNGRAAEHQVGKDGCMTVNCRGSREHYKKQN